MCKEKGEAHPLLERGASIAGTSKGHTRHTNQGRKHHLVDKQAKWAQVISISGTKGKGAHYYTRDTFPKKDSIAELEMSYHLYQVLLMLFPFAQLLEDSNIYLSLLLVFPMGVFPGSC